MCAGFPTEGDDVLEKRGDFGKSKPLSSFHLADSEFFLCSDE
jgi:hypothetical protein